MDETRDYYDVLGVPCDADNAAIKRAFRKLALKYHPDRNKEAGAADRFKEIAEAYAVLSDSAKRANYDARGHVGVAGIPPEDLFGGIDFEDLFGGLGFDFGGSFFDRIFRRGAAPRRARGQDLEAPLVVPLERVSSGGEETVRVKRRATCGKCHGTGAMPGTEPKPCSACNGTGRISKEERRGGVFFRQVTTCAECGGRGNIIEHPCDACGGSGEAVEEEALTVKVPIGVEEGMALRIPGRGMASAIDGGQPGDLFVVVRTAPDPRFERRGADLWRRETVEVPDAVLGAELDVPTLDGHVRTSIPSGTQPGTVLRLRGKGLPEFGTGRRGDLFLTIAVHVPEALSPDMRALYRRLRTLDEKGDGGPSD